MDVSPGQLKKKSTCKFIEMTVIGTTEAAEVHLDNLD